MHAYFLDVASHASVLEALRSRQFEWAGCPRCSARTVLPLRLWICEEPPPHNPLAAICTICRVHENEMIFRPPPGTVRRTEDDRILEVHLDIMLRQLGLPQSGGDGQTLTNGIAYSADELLWRIDRRAGTSADLIAFQDVRAAVYQKLHSGLLTFDEAEASVWKFVYAAGREWPLETASPTGDLLKALVINLVGGACATAQDEPLPVRLAYAGLVLESYLMLGELTHARIHLGRARKLAASGAENPSARWSLDCAEADILEAEGRDEEADRIRPKTPRPE
jgi:hypothetical protein